MSQPTIEPKDKQVPSENSSEERRLRSVREVMEILGKYMILQDLTLASTTPQSYGVDASSQLSEAESMAYFDQLQEEDRLEEPKPKRLRQVRWREYNLAQTHEKSHFLVLLHDLCQTVDEPEQTMGRPRISLKDIIFSAGLKTYTGFSTRRLTSDLEEAQRNGYIERAPHFNSVYNYLEMKSLTPYLTQLITLSSLPLASVETTFAADASGLSSSQYERWVHAKYGKAKLTHKQRWLKIHIICGTRTHIITSIRVTHSSAGDSPQFIELLEDTSQNFVINEVSADKAYSAEKNLQAVIQKGGMPFIMFRSNTSSTSRTSGEVWKKMYHFFMYNHRWFMERYHRRSNVESTFSMLKAKFGGSLRSKTTTAQINEALFKVLCHNICVVIHSMYELGIDPTFCEEQTFCENSEPSQKVS